MSYKIEGRLLFDRKDKNNKALREKISKSGGRYEWKEGYWLIPTQALYEEIMQELEGGAPTGKGLSLPAPAPAPAPAKLKKDVEPKQAEEAKVIPIKPVSPLPSPSPAPLPTPLQTIPAPMARIDRTVIKAERVLVLPPSILVSLEVSTYGDVKNVTLDRGGSSSDEGGIWVSEEIKTTKRIVRDTEEYGECRQLANKLRSKVASFCRSLHSGTYLCPKEDAETLDRIIKEVKERARAFNAKAKNHFVRVSVIRAEISSDALQAAKEMAYNIQEMLKDMKEAFDECDVKKIRNVASQTKRLVPLVDGADKDVLMDAIKAARAAATEVNNGLKAKEKTIEKIREELNLSQIDQARAWFLEYDVPVEMKQAEDSMAKQRMGDLDFNEVKMVQTNGLNPNRFDL